MRPTLLEFRSSKEKTPSSYDFRTTYDGRSLFFKSPKGDNRRSSFSQEKRFMAYDRLARRTGYRIGPGSYSPENYKEKIKSGSPYKDYHCQQKTENNGYYMVGNCLEFEPEMVLHSKRHLQNERNLNMDTSYLQNRVSKTAATTNNSFNFESGKKFKEAEDFELPKLDKRTKKKTKKNKKKMTQSLKIDKLLKKRFH